VTRTAPRFTLSLLAALAVHALVLAGWTLQPRTSPPASSPLFLRFAPTPMGVAAAPEPSTPQLPRERSHPPKAETAIESLPPSASPMRPSAENSRRPAATSAPTAAAEPPTAAESVPERVAEARPADGQGANSELAAARAGYEQILAAWLDRHKYYPASLRRRGLQGEGVLRVTLARDGHVLELGSFEALPDALLERVAEDWVKRADPFPAVPEEIPGDEYAVRFPVRFQLD